MPELVEILVAKRKKEHQDRKFLAALQGHDLGDGEEEKEKPVTFEDIKARVFSGGQAKDANDILALQGINARQAGFGIGAGLEYVDGKDLENPSW
jgi:hypothetical protein